MAYYGDKCLDEKCNECKDLLCSHDCHDVEIEIIGTVDANTGGITYKPGREP